VSSVTILTDPASGLSVQITNAQLHQTCGVCGEDLQGHWVASFRGSNWQHLNHVMDRLPSVNAAGLHPLRTEEEEPKPKPARVHHRVVYNSTTTVNAFKDVCELEQAEGMALAYFVPLPGGVHYVAVFAEVVGWTP
jgi:hypothetical protein